MRQGPQNGPKVGRQLEFKFERDLRELEVELLHKLLCDARRALELQAKDPNVSRQLRFEFERDLCEPEVELVLQLEFGGAISISRSLS